MSGREVLAIALILIGALMLARNFGFLAWSMRELLSVLWPAAIVACGLSLVLRGCGVSARARRWLILAILVIAGVGLAALATRPPEARPWPWWRPGRAQTRSFEVPAGAHAPAAVRLSVSLGSSRVTIRESDRPGFLFATATYYEVVDEPRLSEEMDGDTLVLEYEKRGAGFGMRFGGMRDTHDLELGAYDLPTGIELDMGSGAAELALGRARIRSIDIEIGSGTVRYDATDVAVEPCESFSFDVGSGRADLVGLGDLGPREIAGSVGSGSARIDLRGQWQPGEAHIALDVGSGQASVTLPEGAGFMLAGRAGSGSVSLDGRRFTRGRIAESRDFDAAPVRLRIDVDVSSGSVTLRTSGSAGEGA